MRFDLQDFLAAKVHLSRKTDGGEYVCTCPECGRASKLWVNSGTGQWICYHCAKGGNLISLIQWLDGVNRSEARRRLIAGSRSQAAGEILQGEEPQQEPEAPPPVTLPPEFIPVFDPKTRMRTWPTYLTERNVPVRTAIVYGLGTCQTGDYGGRLIIPVRLGGVLRTFTARAIAPIDPKYRHPPGDEKSSWLFGLDEAIGAEEAVFVEGPFDVFGVLRAGLSAFGLLGKRMTAAQQNWVGRSGFRKITVLLDPDAAKECREVERQLALTCDNVVRGELPEGTDPGSALPGQILQAVEEAR